MFFLMVVLGWVVCENAWICVVIRLYGHKGIKKWVFDNNRAFVYIHDSVWNSYVCMTCDHDNDIWVCVCEKNEKWVDVYAYVWQWVCE